MKKFFNGLLITISCVLAICLILLAIMPYSHTISSYIGNFSLAFPFILILTLLIFIFSLISRSTLSIIICTIGILCSIPNTIKTISFFPNTETKHSEKSISLISYNVHFFNFFTKGNALDYIRYSDADIICMQEFACEKSLLGDFSLAAIRLKLYKYPYSHIEFLSSNKNMKKGIATFSKYPIIKKEKIDFGNKNHSALNSYIKIKKDTIQVLNCYLESNKLTQTEKDITNWEDENGIIKKIYNKLSEAANKRRRQAEIVSTKENPNIPSIICGDLNDVPNSFVYRKLRGDYDDAFLTLGRGLGTTFHEGFFQFRIDYIFFNKFIEPNLFSIDKIEKSDHYPILFKFEL